MSRAFFADVADALRGFLPRELRAFNAAASGRNVKVWFGADRHEHYEVQLIAPAAVRASGRPARRALEVGFHLEHPSARANEEALDRVRRAERAIGGEAESGAFVGRPSPWLRLSELWHDGDLTSPEAAIEAAARLAEYIAAIEPLRARRAAGGSGRRGRNP